MRRPHAFHDQLGPLETLHSDESSATCRGHQHQHRAFDTIVAVAVIDGHRHRHAAADQDEGHDGDEDERDFRAANVQSENFTRIGPRHGGRAASLPADPATHAHHRAAVRNRVSRSGRGSLRVHVRLTRVTFSVAGAG